MKIKRKRGHERCVIGDMKKDDLIDHLERYRFASKYIDTKTVLDIACGTGYGSAMLKENGATFVTGVDTSNEAINYAKKEYSNLNIKYFLSSITDFNDGIKYDCIVSFETIEHVDDYKAALANIRSLLKDNGLLILSTPNRLVNSPQCLTLSDKPLSPYHVREFTVNEMYNALLDAGFKGIEKYGQKQRIMIKNRLVYSFYYVISTRLNILKEHFSPVVIPCRDEREPRYSVFLCKV